MDCKKIKEWLSDYIEGGLSEEEAAIVAGHLAACADCGEAYEDMKRIIGLMRDIEPVEEPSDLLQNVRRRLETKPSFWERARERFSTPAFRVPAAATVLAAVLLIMLYAPRERIMAPEVPDLTPEPTPAGEVLDVAVVEDLAVAPKGPKDETEATGRALAAGGQEAGGPVAGEPAAGEPEDGSRRAGRQPVVSAETPRPEPRPRRVEEDETPVGDTEWGAVAKTIAEKPPATPGAPVAAEPSPQTPAETQPLSPPATPPVVSVDTDTAFITLQKDADAAAGVESTFQKSMDRAAIRSLSEPSSDERTRERVNLSREQVFVVAVVDSLGGEVNAWEYDDQRRWTAVVATIPSDRYDELRMKLAELGEVTLAIRPSAIGDRHPLPVRIRYVR